jgi:hypothetical protein
MTTKHWDAAYAAVVHSTADPLGQMRVKLKVPQVLGNAVSQWATPSVPVAAAPAVGSVVTVLFLGGDVSHPTYLTSVSSGDAESLTQLTILPATGATYYGLLVRGNTNAGATVSIQQTGTVDHGMSVILEGVGGANNAALNVASENPAFSAMEITGVETGHGSLKIGHVGYTDGSDAAASALSIDVRTTGGGTGTAAQGIFITSTTDAIPGGNAFNVRYDSLDWFVIKGSAAVTGKGIVGIGVPISHVPGGMLEIAQKDTSVYGLYMQAVTGGNDLVHLLDSTGTLRFQVNNAGATVVRGSGLFTSNVVIGSASNDAGGAGSALTMCHTTDPSTNPASGHIIIYCDVNGNLLARTSAGNVRTIAAV